MMTSVGAFPDAFGETPFLMIGIVLLAALLVVQILWAYRRRKNSGNDRVPLEPELSSTEDRMMTCPECGEETEVEYRLCRHCVEDTGRSYIGSGGDGGSRSSGML
jgi:hypothetical protein